ncbi:MAG: hypothetical protein ACFFCI_02305 [Promethearchaeota archaeon]
MSEEDYEYEEEWKLEESNTVVSYDKQYGRLDFEQSDEMYISIRIEDLQQLHTIIEKILTEKYHSWKGITV